MIILDDDDYERVLGYCPMHPALIAFESAYSLLSRFAYCNVMPGKQVVSLFKNKCAKRFNSRTNHLSSLFSVDIESLEQHCALSKKSIYQLFLMPCHLSSDFMASDILRFCPVCIGEGKHYAIFQFSLLASCPIHGASLRVQCIGCGAVTSNTLCAETFNFPFACWHCHRPLSEGGRLVGFPPVINNWANLRLARSYGLLRCRQYSLIHYSLFESSEFYNDSTLQFSRNCEHIEESEREFYVWLEGLVGASCSARNLIGKFIFVRRSALNSVSRHGVDGILAKNYIFLLVGIFKSVYRHIIRKHRICASCLACVLKKVRWSMRGFQLPNCCSGVASLVALRGFWLGEDRPSKQTSTRLLYKNIRAWAVEALRSKPEFDLTQYEQLWLLQHIFTQDILGMWHAYLIMEIEGRGKGEPNRLLFESNYKSSCWALYFDRRVTPNKIYFIVKKPLSSTCDFGTYKCCYRRLSSEIATS